jgi:hypothetical protein
MPPPAKPYHASFTLQGTGVIVKEGKELHTVITSPAGFLLTGAGFKRRRKNKATLVVGSTS